MGHILRMNNSWLIGCVLCEEQEFPLVASVLITRTDILVIYGNCMDPSAVLRYMYVAILAENRIFQFPAPLFNAAVEGSYSVIL